MLKMKLDSAKAHGFKGAASFNTFRLGEKWFYKVFDPDVRGDWIEFVHAKDKSVIGYGLFQKALVGSFDDLGARHATNNHFANDLAELRMGLAESYGQPTIAPEDDVSVIYFDSFMPVEDCISRAARLLCIQFPTADSQVAFGSLDRITEEAYGAYTELADAGILSKHDHGDLLVFCGTRQSERMAMPAMRELNNTTDPNNDSDNIQITKW